MVEEMQHGDIFELPIGDSAEDKTPSKKKKKKPVESLRKRRPKPVVEEKTPSAKPAKAADEEDLTDSDLAIPDAEPRAADEVRIAKSIDRGDLETQDVPLDTLPETEDEVTKAKRENPEVAAWDTFLTGLSKGTMGLIYEMGVCGLTQGSRPLTNFRRSDLVKPNGPMLDQHADAIESELAKLGLTLLPEAAAGVIVLGEKMPNNIVPASVRTTRENRLRKLRSTR